MPPKLIPGTSAECIWAGLEQSLPDLNEDELRKLALCVRALVLYSFPDGLPSNKMCMFYMAMKVPRSLPLMSHCSAHLLQIVWYKEGIREPFISIYTSCDQRSVQHSSAGVYGELVR